MGMNEKQMLTPRKLNPQIRTLRIRKSCTSASRYRYHEIHGETYTTVKRQIQKETVFKYLNKHDDSEVKEQYIAEDQKVNG